MSESAKPIVIVQGAQWGSEAKGMVAAALCERRNIDYAVRTGTVNAGHTVYKDGVKYVNQQLPTGWVNPHTKLVIGPGAYVHPEILKAEVNMLMEAGWDGFVYIDRRAGLHLPSHTDKAKASDRHYKFGATNKGGSEAVMDRIRLRSEAVGADPAIRGHYLFFDWWKDQWQEPWMDNVVIGDSVDLLHAAYDVGQSILIEGTQGTHLDLVLGPWPYTTHKQTTASQWVTEAGLSPSMEYEVVLVARTYPIRVAGNSGPMDNEIDWPTLTHEINNKLMSLDRPPMIMPHTVAHYEEEYDRLGGGKYASELVEKSCRASDALAACSAVDQVELRKLWEFTTVTKKLRRIARLNIPDLKRSVMINRPKWLAVTFMNYEFPQYWGLESKVDAKPTITDDAWLDYIMGFEVATGCPVRYLTTGPESEHFHDLYDTR